MSTPNYDINYNDERFTKVNNDKTAALSEMEKTYGGMIEGSDGYFQQQIDATEKWGETQKQNQQAQTDFAIEQINQQKAQAQKDYTKEQSGAYVDWQKQSNAYGANAEQMAAQGMSNTGYSESSNVAMYTTYQNRVIAAREAYTKAVLNYDNAIKDARLQNNAALAEIAYQTLQKSLELSLQGFQYKNTLILEKANKKTELDQIYHSRYQDVLDQINKENTLAEEVRQYNENLAEEKRQYDTTLKNQREQFNQQQDLARRQLEAQKSNQAAQLALEREKFAWQKSQASSSSSGGSIKKSSGKKSSGSSSGSSVNKSSSGSSTQSGGNSGVSTYSEAVAYMNKSGVPNSYSSSIMTKSEWQRRKSNYPYSTYEAYLNDVVKYNISKHGK